MTMQIPDVLFWGGVEHTLVGGSLDFKKEFSEVIFPKFERISSACWRGYIATWMIDDNDWLRIARVDYFADIDDDGDSANQLYNLLPNDSPVAVLGFSGEVTAGYGEVSRFGMYARSYSNYRVFNFVDGKLANYEEHDRVWWEKDHEAYELPDFLRK